MAHRHFAYAMSCAAVLASTVGYAGQVSQDSMAEASPPFGGPANVAYAETLWAALEGAPSSWARTPSDRCPTRAQNRMA